MRVTVLTTAETLTPREVLAQLAGMQRTDDEVADVFADGMLLCELGPQLTCTEANALASLLVNHGFMSSAVVLLQSHAESDDADDLHYDWRF